MHSTKLTREEFINRLLNIYGDRFDLSGVIYVNKHINVDIKCKKHGVFSIRPDHLYRDSYCFTNNIPLIRIPHWNKDKIGEILSEQLIYSKVA